MQRLFWGLKKETTTGVVKRGAAANGCCSRMVLQGRRMAKVLPWRAGLKGLGLGWREFCAGVYPLSSIHWEKTL